MFSIYLLTITLCISYGYAAPPDKAYTLKNIKLMGENCFIAYDTGKSTKDIKLEPVQDKGNNANVI